MKHPKDFKQCIVIILISLIGFLAFKLCNKDEKMTRFYSAESKHCYYLLMLVYTVFVIGIVFNLRYFFNFYSKNIFRYVKKHI